MALAAVSNPFQSSMDTPTRAPSSLGRASSVLITSLKPQRSFTHSRTSSIDKSKSSVQAPVQSRKVLGGHNGASGWGVGQQTNTQDLANLSLELDNDISLGHIEIATDGSERARRTLEEEIRRGMDLLRGGERDDAASAGFGGDLSDADEQQTYGAAGAYESEQERFRARIEDESDSNGSGEANELAARAATTNNDERGAQVSSDDDELTCLSLARSAKSSPQQQQPKPATSLSNVTRATLASFGARPNENARPTSFTQQTARPSVYRPSPLGSHIRPSPSLGPFPSSTAAPLPRAPAGTRPPKSAAVSFNTKVNSWSNNRGVTDTETETEGEHEQSNRMRLPDVTGLTEGLQSPVKARGHFAVPAPTPATTTSSDGALLSSALGSMRAKLAQLESENARSDARVRELEATLAKDKAQAQAAAAASPVRQPSRAAAPEPARPSALENDVRALRAQVQQLAHSLQAQAASLASLNRPTAAHEFASSSEVNNIRNGLDRLTSEVDGVKVVVETLLTDRDQRDRIGAWEREERARRAAMEVDDDRTPRAAEKRPLRTSGFRRSNAREEAPTPGRSFLGDEEVQRMRDEILSPSPRSRRTAHPEHRPASAHSHSAHVHNSYSTSAASSSVASVSEASTTVEEDDVEDEEVERSFRRARDIFRSVSTPVDGAHRQHGGKNGVCSMCARPLADASNDLPRSAPAKVAQWEAPATAAPKHRSSREKEKAKSTRKSTKEAAPAPSPAAAAHAQDTLFKVLYDLEADFSTHKKLYLELSEQYKRMDNKVSGTRRRALAAHLKESIDELEMKADQVRKLHQLLHPKARRA